MCHDLVTSNFILSKGLDRVSTIKTHPCKTNEWITISEKNKIIHVENNSKVVSNTHIHHDKE